MELREVMQKRKSIRQYLTTPVEEEKVKAMIEAAILAPTWKNAHEIRQVLMQLINGTFSSDTELFRDIYDSLLNTKNCSRADQYFILGEFRSYAEAQKRVEAAYKDEKKWAKMALLNTACSGKFSSDRTIQEYVDDIWHLDKVIVRKK